MFLPTVEFHQTTTLDEASAMLRRFGNGARLLAGGTDLLVDLKAGRVQADHIISITRIAELKRITLVDGSLRIGALATITQIDESPEVRRSFAPIRDATQRMAVRQVRNVATIGGNLASAVPCADLPPILTVLGASVELWSPAGVREVPMGSFITGVRRTARQGDEIISAITVPAIQPEFGAAYSRFGLREGNAIAVAAVAAGFSLDADGRIDAARIVLGAVAPTPKVARVAAESLRGTKPDEDSFSAAAQIARTEADPIADVRGSADFRRELVEVLTKRALRAAHGRAQERLQQRPGGGVR